MNKTYANKLGVIIGIISILSFLIPIIVGSSLIVSSVMGLLSLALFIGISIYFVARQRKEQGNTITFMESFYTVVVGLIIGSLISTLFTLVYINFIDTSYVDKMVDSQIETIAKFVDGANNDSAFQALTDTEDRIRNGFTPVGMAKNFGFMVLLYALFGAIVGAVMKRAPLDTGNDLHETSVS